MVMSNGAGAPVPVRFGGAGSVSSKRDCIIVGEFTPEYNKIRVRLKGLGPNAATGIDNRVYERENNSEDNSVIGVVGRGRWDQGLLDTQPEAALALHRGMGNNNGENYSYEICVMESAEVRGRRQYGDEESSRTLRNNAGDTPHDLFQYIADFEGVGEALTAEQEFTFTFEKLATGSVRTPTDGTSPFTADDDDQYLMITVEFDWQHGDTPGPRTMSLIYDTQSGGGLNGNAYVFIGNPMCFWPNSEVLGAIAGVQVLSVEYLSGVEPVIERFNCANCDTYAIPVAFARASSNVGVVGYMTQAMANASTDPSEQPPVDSNDWMPYPPSVVEVPGLEQSGTGVYKVFLWAKDAAGNISTVANTVGNASAVTITIA